MLHGIRAPGERWTETDTLLAVALVEYEAGLCSGCGHPLEESTPERHRFEAPPPKRCQACTAISRRREQYTGDEVKHQHALHFYSRRMED